MKMKNRLQGAVKQDGSAETLTGTMWRRWRAIYLIFYVSNHHKTPIHNHPG